MHLEQLEVGLLADAQAALCVFQRLSVVTRFQEYPSQIDTGKKLNALIVKLDGQLQVEMQGFDGSVLLADSIVDNRQVVVRVGNTPLIADALGGLKLFVGKLERLGEIAGLAINAGNAIKDIGQALVDLQRLKDTLCFEELGHAKRILPQGKRANGMPVGVVLIGKPGEEAKLLSYAYALEQATKLRVDPDLTQE